MVQPEPRHSQEQRPAGDTATGHSLDSSTDDENTLKMQYLQYSFNYRAQVKKMLFQITSKTHGSMTSVHHFID